MSDPKIPTFRLDELLVYSPPNENNSLIEEGILKDNSILALVGPAKAGKSMILNSMISALCTGTPLFSSTRSEHGRTVPALVVPRPVRVLLLEQEIGSVDLRDRLRPLHAAHPQKELLSQNLFIHSLDHSLQLDQKTTGLAPIMKLISEVKPTVVAFDPLVEFHTSNENDTQAMRKIMASFDKLREAHGIALIITHHMGKESEQPRQGLDQFRGSTVFTGKVDTAILVSNRGLTLQSRLDFVLRRAKPLPSMFIQISKTDLTARFVCWKGDPHEKEKISAAARENKPE